jgi:DNA-binding CsgD family transcriptional regulator
MNETRPAPAFSGLVLEHLLGLALQSSLTGYEQSLQGLLQLFELTAWACLFPPSFSAGGRHLFMAHHTKPGAPLLQRAAREGWEKFIGEGEIAARRLNELASDLAPAPNCRWRVVQFARGRQTGFTLFLYRAEPKADFSSAELEVLAQVGRQIDRCFLALARQQEQEFYGGLLKLVCDLHPEGICVMDLRRRPVLENRLFRTHMVMWEQGVEAVTQLNLPKQTLLPQVWRQACDEAFAAYQQNPLSPTARLVVSHGPLVYLEQRLNPMETLEGAVRYLAFQNALGVIPYLLLTCSHKRSHSRRLPSLERLAEQHRFSAREIEVARLVLEGASAAEIVDRLKVALPTVKTHIRHLLQKTGMKTRLQFVSLCHR